MALDILALCMAAAGGGDKAQFLSLWNCVTGKPVSDPESLPYTYHTGDYYRVGTVATGGCTHTITVAGTASDEGIYSGTYSVSFTLSNQTSTQYTTIADIANAIGDDNFVTATGTMHTTTAGDIVIVKVLKWLDSGLNSVVALVDSTGQKVGLTATTATTITDTVTGSVSTTNYKPSGTSYTGAASTTVETDTVVVGSVYYFDGTTWLLETDGDSITKEDKENKVTTLSSSSTDTQYPSAKCVYDLVGNVETLLGGLL